MSTTTLAQYLAGRAADFGVRHIFMVTGGGAMFLNDALCASGRHPVPSSFTTNRPQRWPPKPTRASPAASAILNVTTGPGGINALNGVFGAWTDSLPMLVISGQVKRATCLATTPVPGLRQLGDQEGEIIPMVRGITKYAALSSQPEDIAWHLDQALHLATTADRGRSGWISRSTCRARTVDPATLRRFASAA
jgi:acetolactate synthase-1/2/3 large subunit